MLHLLGAAFARLGVELELSGERERDAEQPLDDALVHGAGEINALLELQSLLVLAGGNPRHRGQRSGLAERPQQLALSLLQRRRAPIAVADDHADPTTSRNHWHADDVRQAEALGILHRNGRIEPLRDVDHAVLLECPPGDRRRLDGHEHVLEVAHVDAEPAGEADAASRRVVAEDDGATQRRQPSGRLA